MISVRWRAYLWVLLALSVFAICATQFNGKSPLQTDLLSLLPPTERNPVAEDAIKKLSGIAGNRIVFLIGNSSSEKLAIQASQDFSKSLQKSHIFKKIISSIPAVDPKQLVDIYIQHRFNFFSDADRNLLNSGKVNLDGRLQQKLYAPFQFGLTQSLADDPFGFTDSWIASLPLRNIKLEPVDGMLVTRTIETLGAKKTPTVKTWVFITAELVGSAYDNKVQQQVVDAVDMAETELKRRYPGADILRTGAVFYAEAARARAEYEIDFIGAGSLIGMLFLLYFVFRSIRPLALGLLSVSFGVATALVVTIELYGEIHLITLVFGVSLIGEAIDYAIQYFAAHLGSGKNWDPIVGLRRISPGLTIALATSLLGYSVLLLAPFPALSQIGLFAIVGLSSAWLSVFLLLPALLDKPNERDPEVAVAGAKHILSWWKTHMGKRECYVIATLILLGSAPGWFQLYGNDDIHILVTRPPGLVSQEEKIRKLTGIGSSNQFFLIEGASVDEVLLNDEKLATRLDNLASHGEISSFQSISKLLPSIEMQQKNHELWADKVFFDESALNHILANIGLRDEIIKHQISDFRASSGNFLLLEDWLKSPISTSTKNLWLGKTTQGFAALSLPQGIRNVTSISQIGVGLPGVTFVDKAASTSLLLHNYRKWGGLWMFGVIALIYGALFIRYKGQQAAIILTPTILAIMLTFGIFGYMHIALTLFNMMALMLVLGVGVNYSIFLSEGGVHAAAALAGVLLSAGTTLLSFGLLVFSSMPALSSFGLTLLIGVGIAVLFAPMTLTFECKHA